MRDDDETGAERDAFVQGRAALKPYPTCGLNADWNCEAWHLGPGPRPNRTSGDYYVLDDEEGPPDSYVLVRRLFDTGADVDEVQELARGTATHCLERARDHQLVDRFADCLRSRLGATHRVQVELTIRDLAVLIEAAGAGFAPGPLSPGYELLTAARRQLGDARDEPETRTEALVQWRARRGIA